MAAELRIADGLALPLDFITDTCGILATKGAGKTYAFSVVAEEVLEAGQRIVIVDPVGVTWGLRSSADGDGPGFPIAILGGAHGDVPLDETMGELVADLLVGSGQSAILDLSEMSGAAMTRFMGEFGERLYQKNRAPMLLELDEADAFAPQRPLPGEQRTLGAIDKIVRRGRARGIGVALVTQRPAAIHKNVLTQIGVMVLLRLAAPQDRSAVDDWIKVHGTPEQREELMTSLPSLPTGEAWVWSPQRGLFQRIHVRTRETFDSSRTPEVGAGVMADRELAPIDLGALKVAFAAAVDHAKDNDPKTLRAEIERLEGELARKPASAVVGHSDEDLARAVDAATVPLLARLRAQEEGWREVKSLGLHLQAAAIMALPKEGEASAESAPEPPKPVPVPRSDPVLPRKRDERLSAPQQAILNTLATLAIAGSERPTRVVVALFSDASPTSSSYNNNLSRLRTLGLVDYPDGGRVALTAAGHQAATTGGPLTLESYRERWYAHLSKPQAAILRELVAATGSKHHLTRPDIAMRTGASVTSSSYTNNLSRLRSLGLINYAAAGDLDAAARWGEHVRSVRARIAALPEPYNDAPKEAA